MNEAKKLEIIEDYIKVNQGEMSQMAFCKKHNIDCIKFTRIAYVIEAKLQDENERLRKALNKYGSHQITCPKDGRGYCYSKSGIAEKECECGFKQAVEGE